MTTSQKPFSTKGLFMHAWDLRDDGVDRLMGWMRDTGLNTMCIAGTYHSGWFIHPHSPTHRIYMTEGNAAYFHPDEKLYSKTPLRLPLASFAKETNWLSVAGSRLEKYGLRMVSWTIGAHSTKLGLQFPEYTQRNAYGDSVPHVLSIGHDATREYLKALCRDLAINYPMHGIQLESFDWMDIQHGHHHERDLTSLTPLEAKLLSICFNPQTVQKAQAAGIDAEKARQAVKATLDAAFREAPDRPQGHPRFMAELEDRSADLKAYNSFRQKLADSLIFEIKQEALQGTQCELYVQTGYDPNVAPALDGFAVWVYGKRSPQVLEAVKEGKAKFPADWKGEYHCYVRLGMGMPASQSELDEVIQAVKQGGATGSIFYNYSESPMKMLGWLKPVLENC